MVKKTKEQNPGEHHVKWEVRPKNNSLSLQFELCRSGMTKTTSVHAVPDMLYQIDEMVHNKLLCS